MALGDAHGELICTINKCSIFFPAKLINVRAICVVSIWDRFILICDAEMKICRRRQAMRECRDRQDSGSVDRGGVGRRS